MTGSVTAACAGMTEERAVLPYTSTNRRLSPMGATTFLCLASYEKGQDFIRACKELGVRVLFMTRESLKDAEWPWDSIDEVFYMPDLFARQDMLHSVSYIARSRKIDRIIPLDEFDLEMAAALREHLRIPGMGETATRYFRDKLAMRLRAREAGIRVPDFCPIINYDALRGFMERVAPPWVLKPRAEASAVGIKKLHEPEQLWHALDALGDRQSFFLLEQFVSGDVYHVDAVVAKGEVPFAEVHRYASSPFDVMHQGGIFATRTIERDSDEAVALERLNREIVAALGLVRGAVHTEFIRSRDDGAFYFLETAARVGGAHIVEMVEAATGVNLWKEWARIEVAEVCGETYRAPVPRKAYAGVLITLARQEWPDLSTYDDPEVVWRLRKRHHAGLVVRSDDPARVEALLARYAERFRDDFAAALPPPERISA